LTWPHVPDIIDHMQKLNGHEPLTFILASGSPRRKGLLALLGLPFVVRPADVQEENHIGESAAQMVQRLSKDKACAVLVQVHSGLILAADTTVCLDGRVLGKPTDSAEAVVILRDLRARQHMVYSGVTVIDVGSGRMCTELVESIVWMRNYDDQEIAAYVASGDPLDKAGAYAIQYGDFAPVARIVGCYANVMGLPLCHIYRLLREIGVAPVQTPVTACNRANKRVCDVAQEILTANPAQHCASCGDTGASAT
jgi:MAF protein